MYIFRCQTLKKRVKKDEFPQKLSTIKVFSRNVEFKNDILAIKVETETLSYSGCFCSRTHSYISRTYETREWVGTIEGGSVADLKFRVKF